VLSFDQYDLANAFYIAESLSSFFGKGPAEYVCSVGDFFAEDFFSDIGIGGALGYDDYSVFEGVPDDGHFGDALCDKPFALGDR